MGSYLSEPVTEKVSTDECNDKLNCGASSMQGWRVTQEDAHNCLLDFDNNGSFFAVYDGHGGHEVAHYCSQKLPQYIKETQAYKDGDIVKALTEGFLGFDGTISTREVVSILKEIAGDKEADEVSDEEENVDNLYKEATMPIEQVIEKYTNLVNPAIKNLKKEGDKFPVSPYLTSKKENEDGACAGSSGCSTAKEKEQCVPSASSEAVSSTSSQSSQIKPEEETKETPVSLDKNGLVPEVKVTSSDNLKNGESPDSVTAKSDVTSSTPAENGEINTPKGKGIIKVSRPKPNNRWPKRNSKELYKSLLDFEQDSDEESEDEDDKTFEEPNDDSSDEGEVLNPHVLPGSDEDSSIEEEEDDEEEEDGEEEVEEEEEEDGVVDEEDLEFTRNMKEEPGSDSGCTAVVALLKENELYVANSGDSRCIVCRNGKAVDMSFDHKPEDEPERERIVKAGGKVTADGRVNGGLNLSRAIGDHAYKQNKELSDREQMITALPDVKTLTINPSNDEFMVLACDGIWNFMSSQEVVDFVRPRILENIKLSSICEEMFDHCLAPNTLGDGTGCDNMTAIIVSFKSNILKRSSSFEQSGDVDVSTVKKARTENVSETDKTVSDSV